MIARLLVVFCVACSSPQPSTTSPDAAPIDPGYAPPIDTSPIAGLTDGTWQWVPIASDMCRDGTPSGIIINAESASSDLVVFVQGGGSCLNAQTCAGTPSTYGAQDAASFTGGDGLLDRTADNPVRDWSYVFVPYCTGDAHAGNNPDAIVDGVAAAQQLVGYVDMELVLARLAPTFPHVTRVVLTGTSAGGSGAYFNYLQVQRAFGATPVELLDDSGPPMSNATVKACFQTYLAQTFRLDRTLLADCGAACADPTNYFIDLAKAIAAANPDRVLGFLDAYDDAAISTLYGQGWQSCDFSTTQPALSASDFEAGQTEARVELAGDSNIGSFLYDSTRHTILMSPDYSSLAVGSTTLVSWIASIAGGAVANVGP